MVGASDDDYKAAEPILLAMGTPYHQGAVGMGETVKLVNQIVISNVMIANVEGLVFAERAGANLDNVRKVLATATGSNYLLEQWLPKTWLAGTFEGDLRSISCGKTSRPRWTRLELWISRCRHRSWRTHSTRIVP